MSKDKPIFGLDISEFQQGLNLRSAKAQDYQFVCIRATGGLSVNGSIYRDREYAAFSRQAKVVGLIQGAYLFLVEKPASQQVDVFMDVVGSLEDKFLMLDFEAYEPNRNFDPQNHTLKEVIAEFRRRGVRKPILVYSGQGYWSYGKPSGPLSNYGDDLIAWDAFYPLGSTSGFGSTLYEQCKGRGWGKRWGGVEPHFWQFTGTGRVSGYSGDVDINAYAGTLEELKALTRAPYAPEHPDICPTCGQRWPEAPPEPPPAPPAPPPPEKPEHPAWLLEPLEYLKQCMGGPYVVWRSGGFTSTAPAWVRNARLGPPDPAEVRRQGAFCIASQNIAHSVNGIYPPDDVGAWYGGVWWCTQHYPRMGVSKKPLGPDEVYPLGSLIIWPYTGSAFASQGHGAVKVGFNEWASWDVARGGNIRTLDSLINEVKGGNRHFFWVEPKDWLKPKE